MTNMGNAALELAAAGWEVFPLRGKVPAIPNPHPRGSAERQTCKGECGHHGHGVLDATTDESTIVEWWADRYQGSNIGARVPANVFVVDVDPRNGGAESLLMLEERNGPMPATLRCWSGRGDGGVHFYFRRPIGKLTDRLLGAGVDVKTSAGYCVVPPSIHPDSGQPYRWDVASIADPPTWLVDLVRPPVPSPLSGAQITQNTHKPRFGTVWDQTSTAHITHNAQNGRSVWDSFAPWSTSVADEFCRISTWSDILVPHGWRCLDPDGDRDGARWLHPSHTSMCSATIRNDCLFVYSTNTPFEVTVHGDRHGYTKFRAWSVLNFAGDMSAAARHFRTIGAIA